MKRILFSSIVLLLALCQNAQADFLIQVNLESRRLTLSEDGREIKTFPVAVTKVIFFKTPLEGRVIATEKRPSWNPTEKTRLYYYNRKGINLPRCVPPGDPLNAMGSGKILIDFGEQIKDPIRIHGTNDESSIGKRITRGCIRLRNKDVLVLIETISGKETKVVIEGEKA